MIHGMVNIGTGIYFDSIQRFQFRPELSFGFDFNFDTRGVQSPYVGFESQPTSFAQLCFTPLVLLPPLLVTFKLYYLITN